MNTYYLSAVGMFIKVDVFLFFASLIWFLIGLVQLVIKKRSKKETKYGKRKIKQGLIGLVVFFILFVISAYIIIINSPFWGSFTGDTLIVTDNGKLSVSQLKVGEKVLSLDEDENLVYSVVSKITSRPALQLYHINDSISTTSEHPFAIQDNKGIISYKPAKELSEGDSLVSDVGNVKQVFSVKQTLNFYPTTVFNIQTAYPNNYFVITKDGSVLVHNKTFAF